MPKGIPKSGSRLSTAGHAHLPDYGPLARAARAVLIARWSQLDEETLKIELVRRWLEATPLTEAPDETEEAAS